jgi:uncharacterized protein
VKRLAASLLLGLLAAGATPALAQEQTIDVVGDASLTARNDTARIAVSTRGRRPTSRAALSVAAVRMRRVLARVRVLGVESRDVETRFVNVGRTNVAPKGRPRRIAFVAVNSVAITVRDVALVGRVVDAAAAGGASGIGGPSFFVADARALYRQALVAAFEVARGKAQDLATQAGRTLGPAVNIREEGFETPTEEDSGAGLIGAPRRGRRAPTPVRPGTTRVRAAVFVSFALE